MTKKMNTRLKKFYNTLSENGLDGLIVSLPANITYLTTYQSRDSYLLVSPKANVYFTDGRYLDEARIQLKGSCRLVKTVDSVFKNIASSCRDLGLKKVGFEGRVMPFAEYKKIGDYLGKSTRLVPTAGLIEKQRQYKDPGEIRKIKKALAITADAFGFAQQLLKPGMTELEVSAELERYIRARGASKSSFDTIVGSGPNSSYPHHQTCARKLRDNEPVLIDMGVEFDGYKSDLTRVFFLGKINFLARKVYAIVREAQEKALEKIAPGVAAREIDAAARSFIARKGFGACFSHSLGHGVGLEVHEEPHLSAKSDAIITETQVFTLEPAIYVAGKFGIRIEDMVLVTGKKGEVLSGAVNK